MKKSENFDMIDENEKKKWRAIDMSVKTLPKRSEVQLEIHGGWRIFMLRMRHGRRNMRHFQPSMGSCLRTGISVTAPIPCFYLSFATKFLLKLERLSVYANQKSHEDLGNGVYQDLVNQAAALAVKVKVLFLLKDRRFFRSAVRKSTNLLTGKRA